MRLLQKHKLPALGPQVQAPPPPGTGSAKLVEGRRAGGLSPPLRAAWRKKNLLPPALAAFAREASSSAG